MFQRLRLEKVLPASKLFNPHWSVRTQFNPNCGKDFDLGPFGQPASALALVEGTLVFVVETRTRRLRVV